MVQPNDARKSIEGVWPDSEDKYTYCSQQPDDSIVFFQTILPDEFNNDSNQAKTKKTNYDPQMHGNFHHSPFLLLITATNTARVTFSM